MNSADRDTTARLENAARQRTHNRAFGFLCQTITPLLTFRQAAQICEMTVEEVLRCATGGAVHRLHNSRGEVLICRNSLQKIATEKQITLPLSLEILQELEAA
jgi:hypothetical protein